MTPGRARQASKSFATVARSVKSSSGASFQTCAPFCRNTHLSICTLSFRIGENRVRKSAEVGPWRPKGTTVEFLTRNSIFSNKHHQSLQWATHHGPIVTRLNLPILYCCPRDFSARGGLTAWALPRCCPWSARCIETRGNARRRRGARGTTRSHSALPHTGYGVRCVRVQQPVLQGPRDPQGTRERFAPPNGSVGSATRALSSEILYHAGNPLPGVRNFTRAHAMQLGTLGSPGSLVPPRSRVLRSVSGLRTGVVEHLVSGSQRDSDVRPFTLPTRTRQFGLHI